MMVIFLLRPVGTLVVGILGDRFGLQTAFLIATGISFLTLPVILTIPEMHK
jgi:MFS family permease